MIEYQEAMGILAAIQGCSFAGIDTVTVPVLKGGKKNPMQGKIEKHVTGSRIMLFTNSNSSGYENKVKRHLIKAGKNPESFVMGSLPWGSRVPNSPFIEHKGEYYMQAVFLEAGAVCYKVTAPLIVNDYEGYDCQLQPGDNILKDEIEGLSDKTGSEHQGLDNDAQVIVRTYKLSSIKALRAFGDEITG